MAIPRRFLPSMQLLRAFEACARLSSMTEAARELNLTQSAVSRQVRSLEALLGGELFVRERQSVRLTLAGEAYAHEVRQTLQRLASASLGFRANPAGGTLRLAMLPTFGMRWLVPRLPGFLQANPGISLHLVTRLAPFDFQLEPLDAAIHFGPPEWPGAELDFLLPERVLPLCSPALRQRYPVECAEDLLAVPLLHLESRPDAWERWFTAQGVDFEQVQGMLLDQFGVAAQAALAGIGVALLPVLLFGEELARGALVPALDLPGHSEESYYLAWPGNRAAYPPLACFRAWLGQQVQAG